MDKLSVYAQRLRARLPGRPGAPVMFSRSYSQDTSSEFEGKKDDIVTVQPMQVGELTTEEATNGGMGRHLGLVSTTFLM